MCLLDINECIYQVLFKLYLKAYEWDKNTKNCCFYMPFPVDLAINSQKPELFPKVLPRIATSGVIPGAESTNKPERSFYKQNGKSHRYKGGP
jgi:hypothetical protein